MWSEKRIAMMKVSKKIVLNEAKKENVRATLVNHERLMQSKRNVVHRSFLDLDIIYKIYIPSYNADVIVNDALCNLLGVDEPMLYRWSIRNFKSKMISVRDAYLEEYDIYMDEEDEDITFVYFTDKYRRYGSFNMVVTDELYELALAKDVRRFYVIPESTAGIIVTDMGIPPQSVQELIRLMNADRNVIPEDKVLSNSLYIYDRVTDSVDILLKG